MDTQQWFERLWADREDRVYPQCFGAINSQIKNLPASMFESLGEKVPYEGFLHHTVLESPPNEARPHWVYVTSGMSNPWGQTPETAVPDGLSGLGFEFVIHARTQAPWAIHTLHWLMAVQLLVACERFKGELLQPNDRVPVSGAVNLSHLLVTTPDAAGLAGAPAPPALSYPPIFQLLSGRAHFLLLVGITQREHDFSQSQGVEGLITLLRHRDIWPLTDPQRVSVI